MSIKSPFTPSVSGRVIVRVSAEAQSDQSESEKIKEQVAKIKRIPDTHERKVSLSLSLGVNRPLRQCELSLIPVGGIL